MGLLVISSKEDAQVIFRDAAAQNMTESGYVWIVTEQALNANNVPDGALGLRLLYAEDEHKHLHVRTVVKPWPSSKVLTLFTYFTIYRIASLCWQRPSITWLLRTRQ